jgi:hypothetical protein
MPQAGRSPVRVPDEVDLFNLPNPSRRIMTLWSSKPLIEMSVRNLLGGEKRPAPGADNLAECLKKMGVSTSSKLMGLHGL